MTYAITSSMWLFYDSAEDAPRLTHLGRVGLVSIPVALASGLLWVAAAIQLGRELGGSGTKTMTQHSSGTVGPPSRFGRLAYWIMCLAGLGGGTLVIVSKGGWFGAGLVMVAFGCAVTLVVADMVSRRPR